MTRAEFLASLGNELSGISTEEREDALKFHSEYFDDAGEGNEQKVIEELGSPQSVAATIRANCVGVPAVVLDSKANTRQADAPSNTSRILLIIIIAVLTFPLWIGLVAAAFGVLISIIAVAFALAATGIALTVFGTILFFVSLFVIAVNTPSAIFTAGVGLIFAAIGIIITAIMILVIGKGFPLLGKCIGKLFQSLFGRRKKQ